MKIKTTMKYYLTPVKMAIMKMYIQKNVGESVEKRNPPPLLVGIYIPTNSGGGFPFLCRLSDDDHYDQCEVVPN